MHGRTLTLIAHLALAGLVGCIDSPEFQESSGDAAPTDDDSSDASAPSDDGLSPDADASSDPGPEGTEGGELPPEVAGGCGLEIALIQPPVVQVVVGTPVSLDYELAGPLADRGVEVSTSVEPPGLDVWLAAQMDESGWVFTPLLPGDADFASLTATVTMRAEARGCVAETAAEIRVLGDVWAADYAADQIDVYRSDGVLVKPGLLSVPEPTHLMEIDDPREPGSTPVVLVGTAGSGALLYTPEGDPIDGFFAEAPPDIRAGVRRAEGSIWLGGQGREIRLFSAQGELLEVVDIDPTSASGMVTSIANFGPGLSHLLVFDKDQTSNLYQIEGESVSKYPQSHPIAGSTDPLEYLQLSRARSGAVWMTVRRSVGGNQDYLARLTTGGSIGAESPGPVPTGLTGTGLTALGPFALAVTNDGVLKFGEDATLIGTFSAETPRALMVRGGP